MDMGIALARLWVCNEGFRYVRAEKPPERTGYVYTGSFTL